MSSSPLSMASSKSAISSPQSNIAQATSKPYSPTRTTGSTATTLSRASSSSSSSITASPASSASSLSSSGVSRKDTRRTGTPILGSSFALTSSSYRSSSLSGKQPKLPDTAAHTSQSPEKPLSGKVNTPAPLGYPPALSPRTPLKKTLTTPLLGLHSNDMMRVVRDAELDPVDTDLDIGPPLIAVPSPPPAFMTTHLNLQGKLRLTRNVLANGTLLLGSVMLSLNNSSDSQKLRRVFNLAYSLGITHLLTWVRSNDKVSYSNDGITKEGQAKSAFLCGVLSYDKSANGYIAKLLNVHDPAVELRKGVELKSWRDRVVDTYYTGEIQHKSALQRKWLASSHSKYRITHWKLDSDKMKVYKKQLERSKVVGVAIKILSEERGNGQLATAAVVDVLPSGA